MIQNQDFKNYLSNNKLLIDTLKERDSILLQRLEDVLKVLILITEAKDNQIDPDADAEVIFDTGYSYFYEQLEFIKIYFEKFLNKDFEKLFFYEDLINYILYLDDLEQTLKEHDYLTKTRKQAIDDISKEIEKIITRGEDFDPFITDKFDSILEACLPNDSNLLTTSMIFSRIVDEID